MKDNGCFPNNITYNVVVQGFLRFKKISEMTSFVKEMTGRGFSFDATTIELLINIIRENASVLNMIPELHSIDKKLKFLSLCLFNYDTILSEHSHPMQLQNLKNGN